MDTGRITDYPLAGLKSYLVNQLPDERGFFAEVLRHDWAEFVEEDLSVQANLSFSYPGIVRAWHRHLRGQVDFFLVVKGAMKICAYDDETAHLVEVVGSADKLQLVKVPGHYWHGTKTVSSEPSLTVYFTTRLYDYSDPDEERRPWNDPAVAPKMINGKTGDQRSGKPWDWFAPPHK